MSRAAIAILGGGVAGVVLAKELAATGVADVEILEASARLGGLQQSVRIGGAVYDIGAFVFDPAHDLLRTFPELYDSFVQVPHRSMTLTRHGTFDRYPMTIRGYLRDNGLAHCAMAAADLLASKLLYFKRDTLVRYVKYYLGTTIYERSGLKSYIERFYCTDDTSVDLEFARQRLTPLERECRLRNNLIRILRDAGNHDAQAAPWHCYVRSREGFGHAYHQIIRPALEAAGARIVMNCTIERIARLGEGFIVETDSGSRLYDQVISTIPIPAAARYMNVDLAAHFNTMSLVSLFYRLDGDAGFDASFLYNFTDAGRWKRITLFSSYYGRCEGDDYFVVECTVRGRREDLIESQRRLFEEHIASTPAMRGRLRYEGGLLTPDAYPFYGRGETEAMASAKRQLQDAGLVLAGRQGRFDYLTSNAVAAASRTLAASVAAPHSDAGGR
ncbi:MAG: FAD-dependent oxidoreductase [Bacteroidetes bacterium]|nr:FAD-dependent oxidoreductase [Bacteroidota bacterium]